MSLTKIPGLPKYRVTPCGKIWSDKSDRWLKPSTSPVGYRQVRLYKNSIGTTYLVHRLVCLTWIPNPNKEKEVNHKNGIKTDNRVENLEWSSRAKNARHAGENGLMPHGEGHYLAKLNNQKVREIRDLVKAGEPHRVIAKSYGIEKSLVSKISLGKAWRHVK